LVTTAAAGWALGTARVAAIDGGALDLPRGRSITATGHITAVPRRTDGTVRFPLATPDGRLMVEAREPVPDLPVGRVIRATGEIADPEPWRSAELVRLGVRDLLVARSVALTTGRRSGLLGALDRVRDRAEAALERGTAPEAATLLRGFVLGQDDRIDPITVEEFRDSGLAHLLAVSGQNVILLALLAGAVLAALDVPLRARLLWTLAIIALYVPVAGAGPSIQRAGVVGAVGIVAALASRPRSSWYALLLAAAVTLALNPRASGDVGWHLSFAAVGGILLWARPIAALLAGRSRLRRGLAEGVGVTVAATLATAPLMAHHFESVSLVSLAANLLALPAVAPVMWLGMLAGGAGQITWLPVEPLTWPAGVLAGYIAQVANWFASPGWAAPTVSLNGPALAAAYVAIGAGMPLVLRWAHRRRALGAASRLGERAWRPAIALALMSILVMATLSGSGPGDAPGGDPDLRLTVLDVGQGDAILLEPREGDPILVDAGPADADVADRLLGRGVDDLAAVVATHGQSDHVGGIGDVLARLCPERLILGVGDRTLAAAAAAHGVATKMVVAGDVVRSGAVRLEVLWPPPELVEPGLRGGDPNRLSLVLLARWRRFEALLTGDAEAEAVGVRPGPVEVLKVAHHGSADSGLGALLETADPQLAVISVGKDNPYGHPAPSTLGELREHGVPALRTDRAGEVVIEAARGQWSIG
jgi:competence protein ComEC